MSDTGVSKTKWPLWKRALRLLLSIFDPRAWAHLIKVVNFYNYSHVAEKRKAVIGSNARISPTVSFSNSENIVIGDNVNIGQNCCIWAGPGSAKITICDDALLAPNVMITAASYRFNEGRPVSQQPMSEADITIEEDCWIGYGAVILKGVTIGRSAVIGAGALVRSDVPEYAILAGNPSKIVGYRKQDNVVPGPM